MAPEKKSCRECFTLINARASKCPECHAKQDYRSAILIFSALILGAAAVLGVMGWFTFQVRALTHSPHVEERKDDIEIVSSRLYFADRGAETGTDVAIVGQLRNTGQLSINRVHVGVRVLNPQGELIDAFYRTIIALVEPGKEVAFKVCEWGQGTHAPKNQYARHKVTVVSAWKH